MIKCIFSLRIKPVYNIYCRRSSEPCAVLLLTNTSTGTCLARFTRRCLNRYLRFWNQFLICSSLICRALANNARSSRDKYCWREKMSSKYLSWNWEKWLRLRFFFATFSPFVLLLRRSLVVVLLVSFSIKTKKNNSNNKNTCFVWTLPQFCLTSGLISLLPRQATKTRALFYFICAVAPTTWPKRSSPLQSPRFFGHVVGEMAIGRYFCVNQAMLLLRWFILILRSLNFFSFSGKLHTER